MEPELIADYQCICGEGPLWHPDEESLYWVDNVTGRMFRHDATTGRHEQLHEGIIVGGITMQADGKLLLFGEHGKVMLWDDGEMENIIAKIPGERGARFNDVIADPAGRVFCGTLPNEEHLGSLYRLNTDGSITHVLSDIGCSNGMGFTLDRKQMYYTDSTAGNIYLFDYDRATGDISNQRTFVHVPNEEGLPDGLTVDAEGYVWSARWDGNCLVRFRPDGSEERRITFPARKVSSLTFGGPNLDDIYVTTAIGGVDKTGEGEGAGALFRISLGIRGLPEFASRIEL